MVFIFLLGVCGSAVGLMAGLNKGKAIAPGFSVHILVIINCVLMSLTYWVTLKKQ